MSDITQTTEYNVMCVADFPALGSTPIKSAKGRCSLELHAAKDRTKDRTKDRAKEIFMSVKNDRKARDVRPLSVLDLGFKSRISELREQNQGSRRRYRSRFNKEEEKVRTRAYETLQNKEGMAERLSKTKFCWSVKQGRQCPHGKDKCKFAHSFDELRIAPCLFGRNCHFVYKENSSYVNQTRGGKMCSYLHPKETRANYLERTGMDKIKLQEPVAIKPEPVTRLIPVQVMKNKYKMTARKKIEVEDEVDDKIEPMCSEDVGGHETYIVPRELAMETFKMALERGESCIKIRMSE